MEPINGYIYLVQTCEYVGENKQIYKIGRTTQQGLKRFEQYPKGTKLITQTICHNCNDTEYKLLSIFR